MRRNRKNQKKFRKEYLDDAAEDDDDSQNYSEDPEQDKALIDLYKKKPTTIPYADRIDDFEQDEEQVEQYENEMMQEKYDNIRRKRERGSTVILDEPTSQDPKIYMVKCKIGTE